MRFNDEAKIAIFYFVKGIIIERNINEVQDYLLCLKDHQNYHNYSNKVIKSIELPSDNREIKDRYYNIKSNLSIVAGLYYGDDLSLRHLERDYKPDLSREQLRQEVMTFTSHILFGRDVSGVEKVGDLRIEKEGLIPIMDGIMVSGKTRQEQKSELMNCLRVYGILSEKSMQEAREAADRDPDVILARNTSQNRGDTSTTISFVEKVASGKRTDGKVVTFAV